MMVYLYKNLLEQTRRGNNLFVWLGWGANSLALFIACFWFFTGLYLAWDAPPRVWQFTAICLKITAALGIIYLYLKNRSCFWSDLTAATALDNVAARGDDAFRNALLLTGTDDALDEVLNQKANEAAAGLRPPIQRRNAGLAGLVLLLTLLGTLGFAILSPDVFNRSFNMYYWGKAPLTEHQTSVQIEPGSVTIPRHSALSIKVVNPEPGAEHTLFYGRDNIWRQLAVKDNYTFYNLEDGFLYYVKTPWACSDTFAVQVFDQPVLTTFTAHITYPSYTRLSEESDKTGTFEALTGSTITLEYTANNPLEQSRVVFADGTVIEARRTGPSSFAAAFTLRGSCRYYLDGKDIYGNGLAKAEREITALPDNPPEVSITVPAADTVLNQNMLVPMTFTASDDYGLTNMFLHYQFGDSETTLAVKEHLEGTMSEPDYLLDLHALEMFPGDMVTVWAEVTDNSPARQKGFSARRQLRLPSMEEMYKEIEQQEDESRSDLSRTLQQTRELQKQAEEKRLDVLKKDKLDWQDKKDVQDLLKKQEDLNKSVEKAGEEYQNLIDKMRDNHGLADETLQKMDKIRELMEQINNPELQNAMQKLQNSLQNLDPNMLKKAMQDYKLNLEDFSQKLDQTIKLLEQVKKEQSVQKAFEISKEMTALQEQINKQTQNGESDPRELARRQRSLQQTREALEKQLKQSAGLMSDPADAQNRQALEEMARQMEQGDLQKNMEQSAQALQQNNRGGARDPQEKALQQMQQMTAGLAGLKNSMQSSGMQMSTEALGQAVTQMLALARLQEQSAGRYAGDPYVILPDQLAVHESIQRVIAKLFSAPMISLMLSPKFTVDYKYTEAAFNDMFTTINDANLQPVGKDLNEIRKGINLMVYDLMQSQQNGGGGGSGGMQQLMSMLQGMGQEQMAMNMLTQQLLEQMQQNGGSLTQEMREQMGRMAASEEQLAQNLRRAIQDNPAAQQMSGQLEKAAQDLENVARNLRAGRLDRNTAEVQEHILSRLLDAQKSINKRDNSRKREARTAQDAPARQVQDLKLQMQDPATRAQLNRDAQAYPRVYREVIRAYLKQLGSRP